EARVAAVLEELHQEKVQFGSQYAVYSPQINSKLLALSAYLAGADTRPTTQSYAVFEDLSRRVDEQPRGLREIVANDLPRVGEHLLRANVPLIAIDLGLDDRSARGAQGS